MKQRARKKTLQRQIGADRRTKILKFFKLVGAKLPRYVDLDEYHKWPQGFGTFPARPYDMTGKSASDIALIPMPGCRPSDATLTLHPLARTLGVKTSTFDQ